MRRTVWTLLFALLLQLMAGNAWAWRAAQAGSHLSHGHTSHCHGTVMQNAVSDSHHPPGQSHALSAQIDSHHCCVIGLGETVYPQLQPLPQATPTSQHGAWASLSLRPDLRPPI